MKRHERLDATTAPDGTVLTLYRHDGEYAILVGGIELMSTRRPHSEERLAELVCTPLRDAAAPHVLIGGLGLGFTLRAALRVLPADARVTVVELLGDVIRWNQHPEYALAGDALRDPRVTLVHDDVARTLAASLGMFDGIMLDVDNGADAMVTSHNARLYDTAGIRMAVAAMRAGGRLAYWSADPDPAFAETLRRCGLTVETNEARPYAGAKGGPAHALYVTRLER